MGNMPSDAWLEVPRPAPVQPEIRAMLMTFRQALLMAVAAIELYLGIAPKR